MVDRSHFRGPTANVGAHPRYQWLTEVTPVIELDGLSRCAAPFAERMLRIPTRTADVRS
jgi:hypothetical protein